MRQNRQRAPLVLTRNVLVILRNVLYYFPMAHAILDEVFVSIQGEGPHVGRRHIFVRFLGCGIRCRYCDTPAARGAPDPAAGQQLCWAQKSPHAFDRETTPNPVSPSALSRFCSRLVVRGLTRPVLSLTGGEPLIQAGFLQEWLPRVRKEYAVYLETCGIHHEEMKLLRDQVDIVGMDMKLPSATGLRPYWEEHRKFLAAAFGREVFVKAVVTGDTTVEDVQEAAAIIAGTDRSIPLIIQPASGPLAPVPQKLLRLQEAVLGMVEDVRVIPQVHKMLNLP